MAILAECPICRKKQATKNKICSCGESLDKAKRSKRVKYWIQYRLPNGKQRKEFVGNSIEEARAADGKRKVQKRENRIFDIMPEAKMTFQELTDWYLGLERVKALPRFRVMNVRLQTFNSKFADMIINRIRLADLENFQARRKAEGLADASVDDEISVMKTVINTAFDNGLVGGPTLRTFRKVKKLLKRNANARDRILSLDEFNHIMEKLQAHMRPIFATGYYTGMRLSEIVALTWDKVDLKVRIIQLEAPDTKDNEPRQVPILDELYFILKSLPRAIHDNHLFLYRARPIENVRKAVKMACEDAGVFYGRKVKGGFTFHDLRHTFNTNMRKAGVDESVIMAITGHSTRDMFDRYNTVDMEDTRQAMGQLQVFLANVTQNVTQKNVL